MTNRLKFFTTFSFRPEYSLFLEESRAFLVSCSGTGESGPVRKFEEAGFEPLLEQIQQHLRQKPAGRLNVILTGAFFTERSVSFPFRNRKAVALALPEELAPLLPEPLSEYLYDFVIPSDASLPVTVWLLALDTWRKMTDAFRPLRFSVTTLDLVLSRHPALQNKNTALILSRSGSVGRLILFRNNRFAAGRSFLFNPENYSRRLEEEKNIFLRSSRITENPEPVEFVLDEKTAGAFSGRLNIFRFQAPGKPAFASGELAGRLAAAAGLVLLAALLFFSYRAKNQAAQACRTARENLAGQSNLLPGEKNPLAALLGDKTVLRLVRRDASPLKTFSAFTDSVPTDLPLVLDYLEIDREKLTLTGTLASPGQVDRLLKSILSSGTFNSPVLGELKLDAGSVKFPATFQITPPEGKK